MCGPAINIIIEYIFHHTFRITIQQSSFSSFDIWFNTHLVKSIEIPEINYMLILKSHEFNFDWI